MGRTVQLAVVYSKHAYGGDFSRSRSFEEATNDTLKIFNLVTELFDEFYDGRPVRRLSVSLMKLEEEQLMQLSLFDEHKLRNRELGRTMDGLRRKYGPTTILRAVSYTKAGTAKKRAKLIGGHIK